MQSHHTLIDSHPATITGSGTYGTAYFIDDGNCRIAKILNGHTKKLRRKYNTLYALLNKHLLVIGAEPHDTAEAAIDTVRTHSMQMMSSTPILLLENADQTITRAAASAVGRWAPLVLRRTDGYYYALHRDADLVMREMHAVLPILKTVGPGVVAVELEVVVKDETDVYMAMMMPRLYKTHHQLDATMRLSPEYRTILRRWSARLIPLVAQFLAHGVVHTDISRKNVMIDENHDSYLIDLDSCLRIERAVELEPAVGLISLVPEDKWGDAYLYRPEVLIYAMVFAALVCTVPTDVVPKTLYPARTQSDVLDAHDMLWTLLDSTTRASVDSLLGNTRRMAHDFAATVFDREE